MVAIRFRRPASLSAGSGCRCGPRILIDELAALAYVNERAIRRRIENILGPALSQDRAVGVTVIGAIQDPRPRKPCLPATSSVASRAATCQGEVVVSGARCERVELLVPPTRKASSHFGLLQFVAEVSCSP